MDQERIEQISPALAAGDSRRGVLRALGVVGASGLLAVAGLEVGASKRPHQHLQDRSKRRNRKQRNKSQDQNQNTNQPNKNNNNNNSNGGGLGSALGGLGVSVEFWNQNTVSYPIRVLGPNGDVSYVYDQGERSILSFTDGSAYTPAVIFVIEGPGWTDELYIQAWNPFVGQPTVDYDKAQNCLTPSGDTNEPGSPINCGANMSHNALAEAGSFTFTWEGTSFKVERQSDSDDYKMFLVTALGNA
jgi:hypothetical protein